jgi:hypothetical protein
LPIFSLIQGLHRDTEAVRKKSSLLLRAPVFLMADANPPGAPRPAGAPPPDTNSVPSASWTRLAADEEAAAIRAASGPAAPKPFSPPPPGWEPPSLAQLWSYANRRHPYARLGYGAAVLVGGLGAWAAWSTREGREEREKKR